MGNGEWGMGNGEWGMGDKGSQRRAEVPSVEATGTGLGGITN
jgi:hypothetical protein